MITVLLSGFLLAAPLQQRLPRVELQTARTSNVGVPLARPDLYDGLMVATVLGPAVARPLPGDPDLAVQPVRVMDSRAFATGGVVEVYYRAAARGLRALPSGVAVDQAGAPPVGARVLLVARAAQGDRLRVPDLDEWETPDREVLTLPAGSPPSAYGETFFLTARDRLSPSADPKWRFVESLAQAIPGAGDANAVEITGFMHTFQGRRPDNNYGQPDDRLSRTFAEAVAGDTAYHRALVDFALNDLRYWGYGDRYYVEMRVAADDPNAFPDGVRLPEFWEDLNWKNGVNAPLPKDFQHTSGTTWDEYRAILRHAKNPFISAWLLQGMPKPSPADVQSLARFLDSPDAILRWTFVERLCAWYGGIAPPRPTEDRQFDGTVRLDYSGLDEAVAAWKAKLPTLAP